MSETTTMPETKEVKAPHREGDIRTEGYVPHKPAVPPPPKDP